MAKINRREHVLRKLAALPPQVRSAVRQALAQGADEIVAQMKRLAPKDTGALAGSIRASFGAAPADARLTVRGGAGDPDLTVFITAGGAEVPYAQFVEFGAAPHIAGGRFAGALHPGTAAQPFFYPTFRANRRRVRARVSRAITKAARAVAAS